MRVIVELKFPVPEDGEKVQVIPAVAPPAVRLTISEVEFLVLTVTVASAICPGITDPTVGFTLIPNT